MSGCQDLTVVSGWGGATPRPVVHCLLLSSGPGTRETVAD